MGSNYFTTNENVFEVAELLANQNFKELLPTDDYAKCNHVVIDKAKKLFWLTGDKTIQHTTKVIALNQKQSIQNTTIKNILKWAN